ncbi:MAG: toll/interleukin-1 receptor domain-containing protein [Candidatus Tenebribacter davisii]|nr:toll/interleukin-1 receptor domain-containing protein [Candidatus Tenebribacter davisii]
MLTYDFAISYAGEDKTIAEKIISHIHSRYADYMVFFAPNEQHQLVGRDGESFFEEMFSTCKQVIVLISESYKKKNWPRYEWDVILKRHKENRFIPVRLDEAQICGLPSSIICLSYNNNSLDIAEICIKKLLHFEKKKDIRRKSEFERTRESITNSKGATEKSYQLAVNKKQRKTLADIKSPYSTFTPCYKVIEKEWLNKKVVKRLFVNIMLPKNLSKEEVKYNIDFCIATEFNKEKPDALGILAYCKDKNYDKKNPVPNVARADFAPYGDWGKADEGVAYDLPVESFETKIVFYEEYWDSNLPKRTLETIAGDIFAEMIKDRKY